MKKDDLRKRFKSPERGYGPTPFMALNDDLDPDRLRAALAEFAAKGCAGVFMHARTGLEVPYLSETFWERIGLIIEECKKLGLKAWIYDEYNWPSGVAGGRALDSHPEFLMPYLEYAYLGLTGGEELVHSGKAVAAFTVGAKVEDFSLHIKDGRLHAPDDFDGNVILFYEDRVTDNTFATQNAPWCSGVTGYLDLMNPEAVEHFIALTHREYARRFQPHFGSTVPGLFTDEPQFYRGFPWTQALPALFRESKGYDLMERLYMLALDRSDFRKLRADFYETVETLYARSFYEKVRRWCDEQGLIFTGHLGMEERLRELAINHGGIYKPLRALAMPGIDALGHGNPVTGGLVNMESPHFAPRAAAAISRLHADGRVLCETGGGSGWEATPFSLKRQLDWLFASGVTFINPHQSLLSVKGLRKRDFPVSNFKQEPWWEFYRYHSEYIARMSMVTSEARPVADLLFFLPTSALRAAQKGRGPELSDDASRIIIPFHSIMEFLVRNQRDFELLFEDSVAEGKVQVKGDRLVMGEAEFKVLVMTPASVVHPSVPDLLAEFLDAGGKAVIFDHPPRFDLSGEDVTAKILPPLRRAMNEGRAIQPVSNAGFTREGLLSYIDKLCPPDLKIQGDYHEDMIARHLLLDGHDLYFIANLGDETVDAHIALRSARSDLERLDPVSGECLSWPWSPEGEGAKIRMRFLPGESFVLAFGDDAGPEAVRVHAVEDRVMELGPDKIKLLSQGPRVEVDTSAGKISHDGPQPPLPITLAPEWEIEPEKKNVMLIEPWNVKTGKPRAKDLSTLAAEKYYTARTRRLIRIGRPLLRAVSLLYPLEKRFRTERYFDFSATERMQRPVSKITGIELSRWGLYEATGAMERLRDYLGIYSIMNSFPPLGAEYEARGQFKAEHVPEDLLLVYEDLGVPVSFEINGRPLSGAPQPVDAWDPSCRAYPVSGLVKPGKNRIVMRSRQMDWLASPPNAHSLEPVALMGNFEVRDRKMVKAEKGPRPGADWVKRGYPLYSGPMLFRCHFNLPEEFLSFYLELELTEVCEAAEVSLNGQPAGARIYPPFVFPISGLARAGENELTVRVVNTGVNFFARPRLSGLPGVVRIVPWLLHEIELKEPTS